MTDDSRCIWETTSTEEAAQRQVALIMKYLARSLNSYALKWRFGDSDEQQIVCFEYVSEY